MNLFSYIKQRLPILDVVSEYATLKKAGLYWKGCCPFHHERTPSFSVSPHKEIFYCFGCHVGGDVIAFIAKAEHCSPLEAAKQLADRYKIQLPENVAWEKSSQTQETKELYYKTCEIFAQWCQSQLTKSTAALRYIQQRQITSASVKEFSLGYCPALKPSEWTRGLIAYAQKHGILATNFIDAHILIEGKAGFYSPFEDRIIFPIRDHLGRFVGFGGRIFMPRDDRAKYYNSHDHVFFNKGTTLFGLDRAKKAIAAAESAFLVEGYTDLIIMHQFGFTNTVATLGTACTQEHLNNVARYAQKLFILYDGDAAGQNAIIRLTELCWNAALDPFVITLSSKDDPATFLLAGGDLRKKIEEALDIFSFIIAQRETDFTHKSLQERMATTKKILAIITTLPDPLKRDLLLAQASDALAIPLETLKRELRNTKEKREPTRIGMGETIGEETEGQDPDTKALPVEISQLEKKLFSAILNSNCEIAEEDRELLRLWLPEMLGTLFSKILKVKNKEGSLSEGSLHEGIDITALFEEATDEEKEFLSGRLMEAETQANPTKANLVLADFLIQFYKKQWKMAVHDVKLKIYEAQQAGDGERVKKMLTDINELKKKMLRRGIHD